MLAVSMGSSRTGVFCGESSAMTGLVGGLCSQHSGISGRKCWLLVGIPLAPRQLQTTWKIPTFILIRTQILLPWTQISLVLCSCCYHLWQCKGLRLTKPLHWLILLPATLFHTQQKLAVQKIRCLLLHDTESGLFLSGIYAFGSSKTKDSSNVTSAAPWASLQKFNRSHYYYIFTEVSPAFFACQELTCFLCLGFSTIIWQ